MFKKLLIVLLLLNATFSFSQSEGTKSTYVYFSDFGDNKIKVYRLNTVLEELTFVSEITTSQGAPWPLIANPEKTKLYSGNWVGNGGTATGKIESFTIDNSTGGLAFLNSVDAVWSPVHISLSNDAKYLLTASYMGNKIASQGIDVDGKVNATFKSNITLPASSAPHMIKTNPDNTIVYTANFSSNLMKQYSFNEVSGVLSSMTPSEVVIGATHIGPRHFDFNKTVGVTYLSIQNTNELIVMSHNAAGLTSTPLQTLDLLEANPTDTRRFTSDVKITPDGKFVYCATRRRDHTHGTITAYSVNQSNGELTLIDRYNTTTRVVSFDFDAASGFLIAADENSGVTKLYKIEGNGALTEKHSVDIGSKIRSVVALELDSSNLSSDKISENQIQVSPNPFKNNFTVVLKKRFGKNDKIEVFDLNGSSVKRIKTKIEEKSIAVDLSNVVPGSYVLRIVQEGKIYTAKLLAL
jgi:6-phosphogluconolactonase